MENMEKERVLQGKVALITGASRGIGRAIALRLAELGAKVMIHYHKQVQQAQEVLQAALAAGTTEASVYQADISKVAEVGKMVDSIIAQHQKIDILVNNAGLQRAALLHKMVDADWHEVMDTNLSSVFYLCRAVLPAMLAANAGHIINIASASAYMAHKGAASYVASKYGMIGLTKVLAMETADKGILVNAVAPGATDTDLMRSMTDVQRERLLALVPMKRVAQPEEVAAMVAWIITDLRYSTGNVFHISGGVVMG